MHLKVAEAEKEDHTAVVVNAEVTEVAKEKAMAAETEEVLVEAEDVRAQAQAADSEIFLVNPVKAEMQVEAEDAKAAEAETEDADLNSQ